MSDTELVLNGVVKTKCWVFADLAGRWRVELSLVDIRRPKQDCAAFDGSQALRSDMPRFRPPVRLFPLPRLSLSRSPPSH